MAEGTVHTGSPAKFPAKPTEEWKQNRKMYAIKQIKICAEYRDMLLEKSHWKINHMVTTEYIILA